jgi:putative ABC transport system permease protein
MVSLARSSLIYEWHRYLAAVLAVSFSGLLILIQLALLLGMFGTISAYIDQSEADLWVGYPGTKSVDLGRNIASSNEVFLRMHPEVERIERFLTGYGAWRQPGGGTVSTSLIGIDTRPQALALARRIPVLLRAALDEPDTIVVDVADLEKLQVRIGSRAEVNGRTVKAVGTVQGLRAIGGAYIFASLSTAQRLLDPTGRVGDETTYFLLKLAHPELTERVREQLTPAGRRQPYTLWEAHTFSVQSQLYWLFESGAGVGAGFASLLGLAVGVVITSQTLMATILASLREYATLRALGVSLASLRRVVLEQSCWIGVVGLSITALLACAIGYLARRAAISMTFPAWLIAATALLTLAIAIGSGLYALRPLFKSAPADLLR